LGYHGTCGLGFSYSNLLYKKQLVNVKRTNSMRIKLWRRIMNADSSQKKSRCNFQPKKIEAGILHNGATGIKMMFENATQAETFFATLKKRVDEIKCLSEKRS